MSDYTDAASPRPGYNGASGTDDRELFLKEFGQMVFEAWKETNYFEGHFHQETIGSGKSWQFPIIGRKRDAQDHVPGELILGGGIENDEVVITLDNTMIDSVFIAEIDQLMASYALAGPYATQIGESLSVTYDKRAAQMAVLTSRIATAPYTGGPVPGYYWDANLKTDPSKLVEAHYSAVQYINERDIGGGAMRSWLPWQQYLLLVQFAGLDTVSTSGGSNISQGTAGPIAGITVTGCNHVPQTNITTGLTKYRGDFSHTVGMITNPQAVGILNRRGMRVTITDKEDRLGTVIIGSKLNGMGSLRAECSYELANASR